MTLDRRQFTRSLVTGSIGLLAAQRSARAERAPRGNPICCFAKPLQHLSYDELAERLAPMGFQGIEATVRQGGQVEPARVEEDLPRLVEALGKRDLRVTIMASDVNSVDQPETRRVLRIAADLGIPFYRMKYYEYDLARPIALQLREIRPQIEGLAALNRELGITAVYQNHAGKHYVGAMLWDIHGLLKGIRPAEIGLAYDIRHAIVEAGLSWPVGFRLVRPNIRAVYVKDFQWQGDRPKNVPLGEGRVGREFFAQLRQTNFEGPISLHMEYIDHRDPALVQQSLQAIARDMKALQALLQG